jgi:urease accessory protein
MMRRSALPWFTLAGLLLPVTAALAHPGDGLHASATPGLLHPLTGIDHLAALLAVGAWSASQAGRGRWLVPAVFLAAMVTGAAVPFAIAADMLEQAIAVTVLVLGLLLAGAFRLPTAAAVGLAATFALFHGAAHGNELPPGASLLEFTAGFAASSAALLALGLAWGRRAAASRGLRIAGALLTVSGLALFA